VPSNVVTRLPAEDGLRSRVAAVAADDHSAAAAPLGDPVELPGDPPGGERAVGYYGRAIPAEVVNHHQHLGAPAVAQDLRVKVQAPALVQRLQGSSSGPACLAHAGDRHAS
jgi:hypothetical protein